MNTRRIIGLGLTVLILGLVTGLGAMSLKERLAIIRGLKNKGLVGENQQGLLEYVSDKKVAEELVRKENAERMASYRKIAEEQGVSVEEVAKQRAVQIIREAKSGEYIKDASGKWIRKE